MSTLPKRKNLRLKNYDYTSNGYYFVTICTKKKRNILGKILDDDIILNDIGIEAQNSILFLPRLFKGVNIDEYIVMPNHVHLIIILNDAEKQLSNIIGSFKSFTNKKYNDINERKGLILWQRNYYEHIIRNDKELHETRKYIINNPRKWIYDKYYNM